MTCPHCGSPASRNGTNRNGTPRYRCKACRKTWSESTGRPWHRPTQGDEPISNAERCRRYREKKRQAP